MPTSLLDLPNDVLRIVAEHVHPNLPTTDIVARKWQPRHYAVQEFRYGWLRDVADLALFNRVCKRLERVTDPVLWRTVSCNDKFSWQGVRDKVDGHVQ